MRTLVDCGCVARIHEDGSGIEIDFCPMHDAKALDTLDDTLQQISNVLLDGMAEVTERRRYALLQAAAVIYSGSLVMIKPVSAPSDGTPHYWENWETAVDSAEQLLAEIEKRESLTGKPLHGELVIQDVPEESQS